MEQLTIFDVMYDFDESRAIIQQMAEFKYCNVLAMIPEDVLSPVEFGLENRNFWYGSVEEKVNRKKWNNYTTAIWNNEFGRDWGTACNLLDEYRVKKEPIKMRVYLHFDFRPNHVVEYLT